MQEERKTRIVYPSPDDVFRAYRLTPFSTVKVVIVGQDPYHNGAAHGLAFSSATDFLPKSLANIFRELRDDLYPNLIGRSADLTDWAKQGVLLINSALTVRAAEPGSHSALGWSRFIERTIELLAKKDVISFVLWGKHAQDLALRYVDVTKHQLIESAHPSPLSAHGGFFGSRPFSRINGYLGFMEEQKIKWVEKAKWAEFNNQTTLL